MNNNSNVVIFDKEYFKNMTFDEVTDWINEIRHELVGSAIFTKNNSLTSKLVRWAESWSCKDNDFKPSHTGSIIAKNGEIYLFDMKPPKSSIQPLSDFLLYTEDDYLLVMRNFKLNTKMFSANISYHIGEFYPYLSALRSVFTKRRTKYVRHCSEMHLTELQKQGLFTDINPEITPDELLHLLIDKNNKEVMS